MKRNLGTALALVFTALLLAGTFPRAGALHAFQKEVPRGPVKIEADQLSYDQDSDTYRAEGNVMIFFSGGSIRADAVTLNRKTDDALAEGNVSLRSNGDVLEGSRLEFNTETRLGTLSSGRAFFEKNHFYLRGRNIEKRGEATYRLKDAEATTCDGACPDWRFTARDLDVTIDGYGVLKHGTFDIRNAPVLYFPYFLFPAKTTRQTGVLLPRVGFSENKLGFDAELPVFWAASESADATFYQRYMSKRGFQEGAELRYFLSPGTFGTLYGDYLYDQWTGTEDIAGTTRVVPDKTERWSYYLNHQSVFSPGFYLRADVNRVSDNYYFRDFDAHNYYLEHYGGAANRRFERISYLGDETLTSLDSKARLVKEWGLYNLTGVMQYTDNFQDPSNDSTLQKYPEIAMKAYLQPLFGSPVQFQMDSAYGYNYRSAGEKGNLFDILPRLSLPVNLGGYAQFTPEAGFRETVWNAGGAPPGEEGKSGSRELAVLGARLSTEFYRLFDANWGGADKVKHGVKPEILYAFVPVIHEAGLPDFVLPVSRQNSLTYSLLNTLTSRSRQKDGSYGYREFMRFKVFQTFDIREALDNTDTSTPEKRPFGPLGAEIEFYPHAYLSLKSTAGLDVNTGDWRYYTTELGLTDERGDLASVQYLYSQGSVEQINLLLKAKVTQALGLQYILRRSVFSDTTLESTYGIGYASQCWGVDFTYTDTVDDQRFLVVFSLLGIGKVGSVSGKSDSLSRPFQ